MCNKCADYNNYALLFKKRDSMIGNDIKACALKHTLISKFTQLYMAKGIPEIELLKVLEYTPFKSRIHEHNSTSPVLVVRI